MAATLLNSGCTSSTTYACSGTARSATDRLITDLGDYKTVLDPALMDDCDSGGPVYVSFYITRYQDALEEFKRRGCVSGGSQGVQLTEGDVALRCKFLHVQADVIVSKQPLGGEAQALKGVK